MVSHESLDGLLRLYGPGPVGPWIAGALNRRTVAAFDTVVCTTGWAAREFTRFGGAPLRVPLGVDLERFSPAFRDEECAGEVMLLHCGRLSAEKQPHLSLNTLAELRAGGIDAELVVAGDGPLREALEAEAVARKLPARFLGYVGDPRGLLATADVVLAPGPIETFGLAALEALASGTPVVVRSESALPEVIGQAGVAAEGDGASFAAAARTLLDRPESERRAAARAQAERFPWSRSVDGFLAAHRIPKAAPRFARGAALPLPPG